MIRNTNGTPFKLKSSLQQFDPENTDHKLFDVWDEEVIKIGGTPLFYFEVFIQDQTIDPLYIEDRGKLFSNFPIQFFGNYEPPDQKNPSTLFGIDTPDEEILIEANYQATLRDVGHMPKRGSRLFSPHRQENWIIIDTKLSEFKLWGALHVQIHCRKFQESLTTGEGNVTQSRPDFEIPRR